MLRPLKLWPEGRPRLGGIGRAASAACCLLLFLPGVLFRFGAEAACLPDAVPVEERQYLDEQGARVPFGIYVQDWDSGWVVSQLAKTLMEERLGYHVNFSDVSGSGTAGLFALAGCADYPNYDTDPKCTLDPVVHRHHAVFEIWYKSKHDEMKAILADMPQLIVDDVGSIGYDGVDGSYVFRRSRDLAYQAEGLALRNYESYDATWHEPWKYFDNWTQYNLSKLTLCEDTQFANTARMQNYLDLTGDINGLDNTSTGYKARCWNGSWWLSPSCRSAPETCVPSITASSWGIWALMQKSAVYNMPVAIAVGKSYSDYLDMAGSFLGVPYYWLPDATFIERRPSLIRFEEYNEQEWLNFIMLSAGEAQYLWKATGPGLVAKAGRLYEMIVRMKISMAQINEMLLDKKMNSSSSLEEVVCRWIRREEGVWKSWIPIVTECAPGKGLVDSDGQFQTRRGASQGCDWCPEGWVSAEYSDDTGATHVCQQCPAGTSQSKPGQIACIECTRGTYTSVNGSRECRRCGIGSYQDASGASTCITCPAPTSTLFQSAQHLSDCVCPAGMYMPIEGKKHCLPCPEGVACNFLNSTEAAIPNPRASVSLEQFPFPAAAPGFMTRVAAPLVPYKCKVALWCPGGKPGLCAMNRDSSAVGCASCMPGRYEGNDSACYQCSGGEAATLMIVAFFALFAGLVFLTFAVNKNVLLTPHSTTSCVIILGLTFTGIQTMGSFIGLTVKWAEPLKSIFSALSLLSLDLKALKAECMVGLDPVRNFAIRQLLAPGSAVFIVFVLMLKKRCVKPSLEYQVEAVNSIGSIFQIFFISIVMSALIPFVCYKHPGDAGFSMSSSPAILCYEDDSHAHMVVVGLSACAIVVFPYTAGVSWATLKYHHFASRSDGSDSMMRMFRFLFFRYHPHAYYYGLVTLLRALLVCLVPVVIRDAPAVQIVAMSSVLLTFAVGQLLVQPWRSEVANVMDGGLAALMVLMLVCAAMSSDFTGVDTLIGVLGAIIFSLFFVVTAVAVVHGIYTRFIPRPYYHRFVCHHKADAAAQARYLQLLLVQRTRQSCFLDSDNLTNLDELFDIVRCRVGRLLVFLTSDTLRRPWCAGEITITFQNHRRLTCIKTPGFVPPTELELESIGGYLDTTDTKLLQYGVTNEFISGAYTWLLTDSVPTVDFPTDLVGRMRFNATVDGIVGSSGHTQSLPTSPLKVLPGMVMLSSDPADDEATACVGILGSKIQASILEFVSAGLFVMADHPDLSSEQISSTVHSARAVVVVLTRGSLESMQQLQVVADSMDPVNADSLQVVPVSTPTFRFPSVKTYREELQARFPGNHGVEICSRIQSFFKRIAVQFATNASEQILDTQAKEVVARIPRKQGACREGSVSIFSVDDLNNDLAQMTPFSKLAGI